MRGVMAKAIVVGSINRDIVAFVTAHPRAGETVVALRGALFAGGKGANQAVALARLGTDVAFVGRVGDDAFGHEMRSYLASEAIDTVGIATVASVPTGLGLITVDAAGENAITVISGANGSWSQGLPKLTLSPGDAVVCQLEIPLAIVVNAFTQAKAAGARTVLNAAPVCALPDHLLRMTDVLVVNEHELVSLAAAGVSSGQAPALHACLAKVLARGPRCVVVTLGSNGVIVGSNDRAAIVVDGYKVDVMDTTGAGDCFVGAFVAEWLGGRSAAEAAHFANAAAALSVTREGASQSLPRRTEVAGWLALRR